MAVRLRLVACAIAAAAAACADPPSAGGGASATGDAVAVDAGDAKAAGVDTAAADFSAADAMVEDLGAVDGQAGDVDKDGGASEVTVGDTAGDSAGDAEVADAGGTAPDAAADVGGSDAADAGPDTDDVAAEVEPPPQPKGLDAIFAHSSSQLYKLDKNVFTFIGAFGFNKNAGQVTDIALDDTGKLFAITFGDLFECDKTTAMCTWLATLPQSFNGLTFVPKDTAVAGKPALIGIANSGDWNLIDVAGGTAKITKLGAYGGFTSSGDAFSVETVGTYATVKAGLAFTDKLVQVNPATGAVLKTVGDTGVGDLWGVAWSGGTLYGFSANGKVYAIDIQTGKAQPAPGLLVPNGVSWWGAGVSTRAAAASGG